MVKVQILENGSMFKSLWSFIKSFLKGKIGEFYNIGLNKNLNNRSIKELINVQKNYKTRKKLKYSL